ncbi:MAG: ATP-dependent zinc protease [Pseudohongiellaceae bacterium]
MAGKARRKTALIILGAAERGTLPELGISSLPMRVDTGAATSSLHVENLQEFKRGGRNWVSFDLHPDIHNVNLGVRITTRVKGRKKVKSSSADTEHRIVIDTLLNLAGQEWVIQLTLTNRAQMTYPMLLGRAAMAGRFLVDPSREHLLTHP